jgi:hypothetical protein
MLNHVLPMEWQILNYFMRLSTKDLNLVKYLTKTQLRYVTLGWQLMVLLVIQGMIEIYWYFAHS